MKTILFVTVLFLFGAPLSSLWAEPVPSLGDLLEPQFKCDVGNAMNVRLRTDVFGALEPRQWVIISDYALKEITTPSDRAHAQRRFRGSYKLVGTLECSDRRGQSVTKLGLESRPFVYSVAEAVPAQPGRWGYLFDEVETAKTTPNGAEAESSAFVGPGIPTAQNRYPPDVRPCVVKIEDLAHGLRKIDYNLLCAGRSERERVEAKKRAAQYLSLWAKFDKSP